MAMMASRRNPDANNNQTASMKSIVSATRRPHIRGHEYRPSQAQEARTAGQGRDEI